MKKSILFLLVSFILSSQIFCEKMIQKPVKNLKEIDQRTFTEKQIYIPYEKFETALKNNEKGVFIPHSDFLKLWEEATKKTKEKEDPVPPFDGAIVSSEYKGSIENEIVKFHGVLEIKALKKKWAKLTLNFDQLAITSVTLKKKDSNPKGNNTNIPLFNPVNKGLELVMPEYGSYILELDFSAKVKTEPGKKIINFNLPASSSTKLELSIPGKDLDVKSESMLSHESVVIGDKTNFKAYLASHGKVNISWLVKTEKKKMEALVFAKLFSTLNITESVYVIDTNIDFSIMQSKTDSLKIKIPETLSLVRVEGENIKEWNIDQKGVLDVTLYEEILGDYRLKIITEKFRNFNENDFRFEALEIPGAKREEGLIAVKTDPALRVKALKSEKVTQVDISELKNIPTSNDMIFIYKYFRSSFELIFNITRIEPKVRANQRIKVLFSDNIIDLNSLVNYTIKDAGIFRLSLLIPKNLRVIEVGNDRTVDSYTVEEKEKNNVLNVVLINKAFKNFSLPVRLEGDYEPGSETFELPKITCKDVEKEDGTIAIYLKSNLKLSTENVKGLRPTSLRELKQYGFNSNLNDMVMTSGYSYSASDYSCPLKIESRKTRVIAEVERTIKIEETALKTSDRVILQILYAPIRKFTVQVPLSIGKEAEITGRDIKEKKFLPMEGNKTGKWEIELHAPVMNNYQLTIKMEQKISEIKTGKKESFKIPELKILDIFNESGFIAIVKSPNLQVETRSSNLEQIDTKELPALMNTAQSTHAFKYLSHPYDLTIESTRHDYEKVLSAIITQSHYDVIISEEGILKTEAVFRIKNSSRQSLEIKMPDGIKKIYSVFILGKRASISRGSDENTKILMLPKDISSEKEFTVRVIYESVIRKEFGFFGKMKIVNAEIKDIPVLKVSWRVYLPVPYVYPYMKGSIHPEKFMERNFEKINSFLRSERTYGRQNIRINQQKILRQNDETNLVGLDVDLVREGKLFKFSKLDKDAFLNILFIKKTIFYQLCIVIILIFAFIYLYLPLKTGIVNKGLFVKSAGVAFILKMFVPQGLKHFVMLALVTIILSGIGHIVMRFLKKQKEKNELGKKLQNEIPSNDLS